MAATNPSYYQSGLCQEIKQKEHRFHLYMFQHVQSTPRENQLVIVDPPKSAMSFGVTAANDWAVRDGPDESTDHLVARGRGFHIADSKTDTNWLFCHSIIFTDARFKGSSLKVLRDYPGVDSEWAIVGGTGEFAFAHGVATVKVIQNPPSGATWELNIRAFCLCIPEQTPVTKMGPWGGNGGTAFDIIPEEPHSLQDVAIKCGDVINSVAFSYTNQAGQKKTAGPWGGDGAQTTTVTLGPSETIKQIIGTTNTVGGDTVITSLTLVSNLRAYGPFGKENGTPFSTQVPDGNIIAGFYARTGGSVNSLGVYACPN